MKYFFEDLKRVPILLLGLCILAMGIYLTLLSEFGLAPWSVFHQGLANVTHISFGWITQIIGAIILTTSMVLFKTKVGLGTVLNILIIGRIIDFFVSLNIPLPSIRFASFLVFILGFILTTLGRSLYISSNLGQGPRDGFFVGLARTANLPVKYVKFMIEFVVFIVGTLLGGTVGYGTIIVVVFSGYCIQFFFFLFKYNPHTVTQHSIVQYFRK